MFCQRQFAGISSIQAAYSSSGKACCRYNAAAKVVEYIGEAASSRVLKPVKEAVLRMVGCGCVV
jgi:hypothetical protein